MDVQPHTKRRQWRPRHDGVLQGQGQGRRGRLTRLVENETDKNTVQDRFHWIKPKGDQASDNTMRGTDVSMKRTSHVNDVTPPRKSGNKYQSAVQTPLPVCVGDTSVNSAMTQKADFRPETKSSCSTTNPEPIYDELEDDFDFSLDLEEGYAEYALKTIRQNLNSVFTSGPALGQVDNEIQQTSAPTWLTPHVTLLTPTGGSEDHVVQCVRSPSALRGLKRKYAEEDEDAYMPCKKLRRSLTNLNCRSQGLQ